MSIVKTLKSYASMTNIAKEAKLSEKELEKIGTKVLTGFNHDKSSMANWLADVKKVEELASLEAKKKSFPLPNSANIKYPLITKAAYEYSSRTYPEILKDGKVVKTRVIGFDADQSKKARCERVADYMNYQLLFEHDDWERDLDVLLTRLALIGFICKKSYYDPKRKQIVDELCEPQDLIIDAKAKSLKDARRITHILHVYLNDLIEGQNAGMYLADPIDDLVDANKDDVLDSKIDLIEQHTFLDLDGDNYSEPYIVTSILSSGKVIRIAPRFTKEMVVGKGDELEYIDAIQLFTDYHFLVSPQGRFQSVGFGILMLHLNETINSVLNQLLDAGQLANLQGGFKDSRLQNLGSGDSNHNPGQFKTVKATAGVTLKDGIVPLMFKEPSSVLFQLLGLLIKTGQDLSSSTGVMTGATNADNAKTGAVQALQAEGIKVFASLQKRLYRSLTSEFKKLYVLNSAYLDPQKYYNVLDDQKSVKQSDFSLKDVDVVPVADPNLSSEAQRTARNQILLAAQQLPGTNKIKLSRLVLDNSNLGVPTDEIMMSEEELKQPDPALLEVQAKIQNMAEQAKLKGHELQIREKELAVEAMKVECQCIELQAKAMLEVAQATAQQDNGRFQEYDMRLKVLQEHAATYQHAAEFGQANQMHQNEMAMRQKEMMNAQQDTSVAQPPSDGEIPSPA